MNNEKSSYPQRIRRLADGSVVQLGGDSRIKVQLTELERRVELNEGAAHFEVAKDSARPFIVTIPKIAVRSHGTVFSLRVRADDTIVEVTEGRASVSRMISGSDKSRPLPLWPGECMTIWNSGRIELNAGTLTKVQTIWPSGELTFHNGTLAEVVAEFNRHNSRHIYIAGRTLSKARFSGRFMPSDTSSFLDYLQRYMGVRVTKTRDGHLVLIEPE